MSPYVVLLLILVLFSCPISNAMVLLKCYQITSQPVNQAICILLLYQLCFAILFQ